MKAPNTTTIEVRKKAIEFDFNSLFQVLTITFLLGIISILLYKNFLLWSIGIIFLSIGAYWVYKVYKELIEFDWSIDVTDFTMEDVIADLESNSYSIQKTDKTQKAQEVVSTTLQ